MKKFGLMMVAALGLMAGLAMAAPPSTFVGVQLTIPFNDTPQVRVKSEAPTVAVAAHTTNSIAPVPTQGVLISAPTADSISTASTSAGISPAAMRAAAPLSQALAGNGNGHGGNSGHDGLNALQKWCLAHPGRRLICP